MMRPSSLRTQLWLWLLGLLTVVGLITAGASYWYTRAEMESFLDHQLRQVAINIDHVGRLSAQPGDNPVPHDLEDDLNIQVWDSAGTALRVTKAQDSIPRQHISGFSDTQSGGLRWRTYTATSPAQTVQVSQQAVVREELAQDAAVRALVPIGIILPLAWLLLGIVTNRVLGGLDGLVRRLAQRSPGDDTQIALTEVPSELRPMVAAVNDLFGQLHRHLLAQKRFVADAAHELRTPLAALQLQINNLRQNNRSDQLGGRIDDLERGIKRASSLAVQLLKMARYQSDEISTQRVPVDLVELMKAAIADVLPIADHRRQDIGLVRADGVVVLGDPADLRVLAGNLLENAIRYTPEGGVIDVSIARGGIGAVIEVVDSGPGIAVDEIARVFEPFYRAAGSGTEGSGLGLAIAARIAERHGLIIELVNRTDRTGLIARIIFPNMAREKTA